MGNRRALDPCLRDGRQSGVHAVFSHKSVFAKVSSVIQTSLVFWTDRFGIPYGLIPNKVKMVCCIGAPILVEQKDNPSSADIEALHEKYVTALRDLFDRHKHRMGKEWENKQLYLENQDADIVQ